MRSVAPRYTRGALLLDLALTPRPAAPLPPDERQVDVSEKELGVLKYVPVNSYARNRGSVCYNG